MKVFGLTGGIACGKSRVAARWRQHGLDVIDADVLAHDVVKPGWPAFEAIVERLGGGGLVADDGTLDRKMLGRIAFNDPDVRKWLESVIHPEVKRLATWHFDTLRADGVELACYEVPLLYENGLEATFSPVVVVHLHEAVQLQRLMKRNSLTEDEARVRIAAQMPLREKVVRADFAIDNTGSVEQLDAQADLVLSFLRHEQLCSEHRVSGLTIARGCCPR